MKEPKPATDKTPPPKRRASPGLTLSLVAIIFVVFMAVFIYLVPMQRFRQSEAAVDELRQRYARLEQAKETEEARLRSQDELMARIKQRKSNFDLWSFMNTALTETKLKDRAVLENFKPRTEKKGASQDVAMVQLRLSGVSLKELVDLLHKVYASGDLVVMYKLEYLRPLADAKGLECNITFLTPKV